MQAEKWRQSPLAKTAVDTKSQPFHDMVATEAALQDQIEKSYHHFGSSSHLG
jgi:hypothetical protein